MPEVSMFDKRKFNYSFIVKVSSGENSKIYNIISQSNYEATKEAMALFSKEFVTKGLGIAASIISYERK